MAKLAAHLLLLVNYTPLAMTAELLRPNSVDDSDVQCRCHQWLRQNTSLGVFAVQGAVPNSLDSTANDCHPPSFNAGMLNTAYVSEALDGMK